MMGWLYRYIDLSTITSPVWRLPVRPSESYDYVLQRMSLEYDSDANDPSNFDSILWRIVLPQQNRAIQDITDYKPRSPVTMTLNPGINDRTAGTTRPKEIFFPSIKIDWPIKSLESFSLEIESYTALTGNVRVLFIGSFILPQNPILETSEAA